MKITYFLDSSWQLNFFFFTFNGKISPLSLSYLSSLLDIFLARVYLQSVAKYWTWMMNSKNATLSISFSRLAFSRHHMNHS